MSNVSIFAPANIALIKYWGKKEDQTPLNDSLSMTLDKTGTFTDAKPVSSTSHKFYFDGRELFPSEEFSKKAFTHLNFLSKELGINDKLEIHSKNTMPHGTGIASSASSMAALTTAAIAAWSKSHSFEDLESHGFSKKRLATLSKMGSGSSCRSFYSGFVEWQKNGHIEQTLDHKSWDLSDLILIFSNKVKSQSSSKGHLTAQSSPFFEIRHSLVSENMYTCKSALNMKNMKRLGEVIEYDTSLMHAVMMTSQPPHNYLNQKTISFIAWLREYRASHDIPAYFTLDAGPNVHTIVPSEFVDTLKSDIRTSFPDVEICSDRVGEGVRFIES